MSRMDEKGKRNSRDFAKHILTPTGFFLVMHLTWKFTKERQMCEFKINEKKNLGT